MITINNLSMHYGEKTLFEDVSFQLNPGKRYGLVGANGSGKTTLLKILERSVEPELGEVNMPARFKIGVLKQNHFEYEEKRIIDTVIMGDSTLWNAFSEKEELLREKEITPHIGHRLGELEMTISDHNGYFAESKAGEMLSGLGIPERQHSLFMSTLSGGYKLRVLLAQCLFNEPDCLLLDEPTNHLDIIAIAWLESFLRDFPGILVVISHDQYFLDNVSTHITDIDYETIKIYKGNYEEYLAAKMLERDQTQTTIDRQEKKKKEMQAFVDRFKAKATKARQAQSRAKMIDKMEDIKIKKSSRVSPGFSFHISRPSGKKVLTMKNISKSFGDKLVLKDLSLNIKRGDKIAVIGPNGIGKSTLLKILMDLIPSSNGTIEWGHEVLISYFAQDHHELICEDSTPYDWLYDFFPHETIGTIRGLLGRMLFSKDDVHKSNGSLSGGEAARLVFSKIILKKSNLLLLDEPTNHMDLEAISALSDALIKYSGTLIFVSHYRHFVQNVATSILSLNENGFDYFPGTYSEYLESKGEDHLDRNSKPTLKNGEKGVTKKNKNDKESNSLNNKERRKLMKDISRLEKKILKLEEQITDFEDEKKELEIKLGSKEIYFKKNQHLLEETQEHAEYVISRLNKTVDEWQQISCELENLKKRYNLI